MSKTEIRELLNQGYELEWEWNGFCYSLLPIWDDPDGQYNIHPTKVDFCVVGPEGVSIEKIYDSLDGVVEEGYDLETMCDLNNPTFSY